MTDYVNAIYRIERLLVSIAERLDTMELNAGIVLVPEDETDHWQLKPEQIEEILNQLKTLEAPLEDNDVSEILDNAIDRLAWLSEWRKTHDR